MLNAEPVVFRPLAVFCLLAGILQSNTRVHFHEIGFLQTVIFTVLRRG